MCQLSWSVACEVLAPRPGIKLMSPALEGGFLTTWTTREVPLKKNKVEMEIIF